LHDFYNTLFNLRTNNPALRAGDPEAKTERLTASDNRHIFAFLRNDGEQQVLVILNFSCTGASFSLDSINGKFRDIFSCKEMEFSNEKSFQLNSWEYLVFERL